MKNKLFYYIGVLVLVLFSFYYTDFATVIIKENDPIMKEIKKESSNYFVEAVNAEVNDNIITPGIKGIKVDINKSYESMKRYGSFNEDLFVFEDIKPSLTVSGIYDKYIRNGNTSNKKISIVFTIEDYSYVSEIINILDSKSIRATFFINNYIFEDSIDLIKLINSSNNEIELYSKDYNDIAKINKIIKSNMNKGLKFCYLDEENNNVLNTCSKNNMHTLIPSINTNTFPYNDVKRGLNNGSIIRLKNNKETLRELKFILDYINQKGYKMVTVEELIKE